MAQHQQDCRGSKSGALLHSSSGKVKWGVSMNRWAAVLHDYLAIRRLVGNCPALRGRTRIQLFEVNQRTLSVWYNDYRKKLEADVLALSVPLPQISMVSHTPLPVAKQKTFVPTDPRTALPPFTFIVNPDMSGQAIRRGQRTPHTAPTPTPPAAALLLLQQPLSLCSSSSRSLSAPPTAALPAPGVAPGTSLSRTTLWRKRKAAEVLAQVQGLPCPKTPGKEYT